MFYIYRDNVLYIQRQFFIYTETMFYIYRDNVLYIQRQCFIYAVQCGDDSELQCGEEDLLHNYGKAKKMGTTSCKECFWFGPCLGSAWLWWGPWRGATTGRTGGTRSRSSPASRSGGSQPPHSPPTTMTSHYITTGVHYGTFIGAWMHQSCLKNRYGTGT